MLGIVCLSVLTTLFVQRTLNPPAAAAQSSQPQEVRASMFTLVGPEGTALARLEPGADGNGRLQLLDTNGTVRVALSGDALLRLFDSAGTQRVGLNGQGALNVFAQDATLRFSASYLSTGNLGAINGIQLDPDGTIETLTGGPRSSAPQSFTAPQPQATRGASLVLHTCRKHKAQAPDWLVVDLS